MIGRTVLGLDLGSYALKVVELTAGLRAVELLRAEALVLPRDVSPEEREATAQLFLERNGFPRDFIVSALGADRVTQRHLRFPFSGAKRVTQAIPFEIQEDLPFPLDRTILAHEAVQSSPGHTDVLAVLAPRPELAEYLTMMRRMEIEPRIVEVEGGVLGNLAGLWGLSDVGRVMLDVGHRKTNLVLLVDGKPVVLRSIPVAGQHFTEAIAKDAQLSWEAAEEQKHERGIFTSGSGQPASPSLKAAIDRLVREAARSVQAVVGDPLAPIAPAEILLIGGSAGISGLAAYVEAHTGLPTQVLGGPPEESGLEVLTSEDAPLFAQATALALRAAPTARSTDTDFRQEEFRFTPDLSALQGQLRFTAALFGLVLFLWGLSLASEYWNLQRQGEQIQDRVGDLYVQTFPDRDAPARPLDALRTELQSTRDLAAHLGVTGTGTSVLDVLRFVSEQVPPELDVNITELRIERHSVSAKGTADSYETVDKVREHLSRVESFETVALSDVVRKPFAALNSFKLNIELKDDSRE